ncbi:transcriptional regulator [Francisella halioticida]|uniref:Transcriptional regulator n=1 Tax=Francisella halioticida TaxID=549298 RepID=A0ABM6M126_9GAMM|nr:metalloregulator ArsR/SmtB family transcription factor [Francisella halioticida]ASG68652.1 transcriptional regulator [Francisella halioticida]BCD91574.1 transcriptional regulator [Francisella halioticida]
MKLADIVDFQKALSDETRIRILMVIYQHELCLCHLAHIFKLANSTISKHLDILRRNGFIHKRKQGRFHYFYFNSIYKGQLNWLLKILEDDNTIQNDQKIIKQMIKEKLEHLPEIHAKESFL